MTAIFPITFYRHARSPDLFIRLISSASSVSLRFKAFGFDQRSSVAGSFYILCSRDWRIAIREYRVA
jgi:hypothetical protein